MHQSIKEKVVDSADVTLPTGAEKFISTSAKQLIPIDYGQVCVNADKKWFEDIRITPPTCEDLVNHQTAKFICRY